MTEPSRRALQRNVQLYPLYQGLLNSYFWLPVFFLYFSENLSLGQVLRLEAIYYATVVLLEVPSGYFSDTVGRKRTLILSSAALIAAYALFFLGSTFAFFAVAQVFLAAGLAFNSGTDTALHFDSLSAIGLASEYGAREARAHQVALLGRSLAALLGGLAAMGGLRLAYGLSLLAAVGMLLVVMAMVEPTAVPRSADRSRRGFLGQLGACLGQLGNPSLAWLFCFAVLMTVINHVPYEFYQPYLDLLLDKHQIDLPGEGTPLLTGTVTAITMLIAAWAASRSIRVRDRVGLAVTLLFTTALQVVIMVVMGLVLHNAVLLLILLRSVPAAMMEPALRAAITPRLPKSLRATYLSIQSLAGRLSFSGVLVGLSFMAAPTAEPQLRWPEISQMSLAAAVLGAVGFFALAATASLCRGAKGDE